MREEEGVGEGGEVIGAIDGDGGIGAIDDDGRPRGSVSGAG